LEPFPAPHLTNFFDAVQSKGELNCPADAAYITQVTAMKVYEAIEAGCTLKLTAEDFTV
jgi:hypothetical protein